MKRLSPRTLVLLVVGLTFVSTFGAVIAYAWSDAEYFAAAYACDTNAYYGTLGNCQGEPGYPNNPTESQCRYNAASAYYSCLEEIPDPVYEMDFCNNARARRDNCLSTWGPEGSDPDGDANYACLLSSGIQFCE